MAHLINPIRSQPIKVTLDDLRSAHEFLVGRAKNSVAALSTYVVPWGIKAKRLNVDLSRSNQPRLVGKDKERFAEVVNMTATIERMMDALEWFAARAEYRELMVSECHPSTSSDVKGNDIVLVSVEGRTKVICEVCDVISEKASQNSKEKKDLDNLGCTRGVPLDGIDRFIVTAPEYAQALTSKLRRWEKKPYRYSSVQLDTSSRTCLLRLESAG